LAQEPQRSARCRRLHQAFILRGG